jgi:hemerythrin superfamily protein
MATRSGNSTRSTKSTSRSGNGRSSQSSEEGAFNWGTTGLVAGAAIGGAALAFAANLGRKLLVQSPIATDHWAKSLAAEHEQVLAMFDKMLATDSSQKFQRSMLLTKLAHALDRHAYAEEHVVYPALRESNDVADAAKLETEHGEVKEFLYRLKNMEADDPRWVDTVREFRASVAAHAKMEEEQVFPQLESELSEELDARLTKEVAKASFMMA